MDLSEFELVFVLVVEGRTVFVNEAHNRGLPTRRSQKPNDHIKEPVLNSKKAKARRRVKVSETSKCQTKM